MKRISFVALFAVLATVFGLTPVRANNYFGGCADGCPPVVCDGACPTTCDQLCHSYCDDACARGGVYAGFEVVFVRPHFEDGRGPSTSPLIGALTGAGTARGDFGVDPSPRVWVGYENADGFGARVRYWQYDQVANPATVQLLPGVTHNVFADLEVHALDAELVQSMLVGNWGFTMSGGVRYASVEMGSVANFSVPAFNADLNARTRQRFDGAGPTVAFEGRRYLGNTNLAVFANSRASLLFGNLKKSASADLQLGAVQFGPVSVRDRSDDLLTVLEMQVGLEWSRVLRNGALFFARAAGEAQVWQGAGGYDDVLSGIAIADAILPGGGPIASSRGDMGFVGVALGAGFAY